MSAGWSLFVFVVTLLTMAAVVWLLLANRSKPADGNELDHEFDGIREYDNPLPAWWVGLFGLSVVFGLGYVFYYPALGNARGASGWTSEKEWLYQSELHEERFAPLFASFADMTPQELMGSRNAMQTGRRLFLNYCSTCHGVAAKGGHAFPNLTDEEWIWGGDYDAIKHTLTHGRQAQMPAWEQVLNAQQLQDVTRYVLSLSSTTASGVDHSDGKASYTLYCTACHGAEGKGNPLLGAPNLTNDIWLYGGTAEDVSQTIAKGRNGMMPAQSDVLGEDRIHLLAAYIKSLSQANSASDQKLAGSD